MVGDMRFAALERRDRGRLGVTPLFECNEFVEALRRRVGVPDRDGGPLPLPLETVRETGLRGEFLGPGEPSVSRSIEESV